MCIEITSKTIERAREDIIAYKVVGMESGYYRSQWDRVQQRALQKKNKLTGGVYKGEIFYYLPFEVIKSPFSYTHGLYLMTKKKDAMIDNINQWILECIIPKGTRILFGLATHSFDAPSILAEQILVLGEV